MVDRKTVLISQVFQPDEQATSQLLSELLAMLAGRGANCAALCGFPAGRRGGNRIPRAEVWRGVDIRRGGLQIDGKASLMARALGYGSYSLWLAWRLLFFTPSNARLLVVTNPPFAPVLVHWCSWLRGWSYDVFLHDIYPDGLVALGKLSERSMVTRLWRRFNRRALASAQNVLVLGRDMAGLVEKHYGVPSGKISYVPNWSPFVPDKTQSAEKTGLWQALKLKGRFVVQYSGNMGLWHDLDTIVRAAALLHADEGIIFLLIGEGRRKAAAMRLSQILDATNMIWLPLQPMTELGDTLSCCHAALISQRAGMEGVAVPSKLYGIMASGRAVLAQVPAQSETALVVAEEACGLVIPLGDAQALADAIRSLAGDRFRTSIMGERALAAYRRKYTLQRAVGQFEGLL